MSEKSIRSGDGIRIGAGQGWVAVAVGKPAGAGQVCGPERVQQHNDRESAERRAAATAEQQQKSAQAGRKTIEL